MGLNLNRGPLVLLENTMSKLTSLKSIACALFFVTATPYPFCFLLLAHSFPSNGGCQVIVSYFGKTLPVRGSGSSGIFLDLLFLP